MINTRKRNTINIVERVQKQWSLAKLGKITFILFGCHRAIDFHSFYYHERVPCNKEFSHGNSKFSYKSQIPVKPNSKQYQFLFKYISSKSQWQNF